MLRDLRLYTCKQEVYFEKKMHVSFSLSLKLAGIEHKVQAAYHKYSNQSAHQNSLIIVLVFQAISPLKSDQTA